MGQPELRSAPPWLMEEMIAAEPDLATDVAAFDASRSRGVAEAVREAAAEGRPVTVVGCGTSEHAAMAVAELLRHVLPQARIEPRQAFEASLDPWASGLCLAISHEGETAATIDAMRAAREGGAATALITAVETSTGAALARHVLVTPLVDRSWCHTVGYLSPILGGLAIAARLSETRLDGLALGARIREILGLRQATEKAARALAAASRYVIVGSGVDRISARELALKIEEGARRPAVGRDLETELHGHLASADDDCGLIAIVIDPSARERRAQRTEQLLRAARRLGMPTAAIVAHGADEMLPAEATSAGRIVLPAAATDGLPGSAGALIDGAVALQLLTLGLVHAHGTNPDLIRREEVAYREAAALAEG